MDKATCNRYKPLVAEAGGQAEYEGKNFYVTFDVTFNGISNDTILQMDTLHEPILFTPTTKIKHRMLSSSELFKKSIVKNAEET